MLKWPNLRQRPQSGVLLLAPVSQDPMAILLQILEFLALLFEPVGVNNYDVRFDNGLTLACASRTLRLESARASLPPT